METTNASPAQPLTMTAEDYIRTRVDDQIEWYGKKSGLNKRWYYRCNVLMIVSGTLIPLLVGYSQGEFEFLKYIAGALGAVVAITQGILSLKKYRENWLTYRSTSEALLREKLLFLNGIGDFADEGYAFKTFVMKAEQIMSGENTTWLTSLAQKEDKKEL